MVEDYGREIKWEGNPDSGWILMDYGEVLVNVMTESAREYYDLESLWANGELIPLDGLVTPNANIGPNEDDEWGTSNPFADWDDDFGSTMANEDAGEFDFGEPEEEAAGDEKPRRKSKRFQDIL
jgi:hypothetical protein